MNIILNPKIEGLKNQINALKAELNNIVTDYELLVNFVCRNIQDKYMSIIGSSKLELLYLEFESRRLKRKIELMQICYNIGKAVNLDEIEEQLDAELKEWQIKLNDYLYEVNNAKMSVEILKYSEDNIELKKLFRKLSKLIHPDINPDLPEKYQLLWLRVYEAYKKCDLDELKTLETLIELDDFQIAVVETEDKLSKLKSRLENSISHYISKIEKVKDTHPYTLINIINNKELMEKQLNEIEQKKSTFQEQIIKYKSIINNMELSGNVGFNLN